MHIQWGSVAVRCLATLSVLAAVGAVTGFAAAEEKRRHESHMHHALHECKEARHELKEAKHDFGGHRAEALKAVDHAIVQLEVAIKHHRPEKKVSEEAKEVKHASHIHHALHELKEARHELKEAKHDFGGHRAEALKAVEHAIRQLEIAVKHHKGA